MRTKEPVIYLILALLVVWVPIFMGAWDKDKPASTTSLRSSNPQMLANNAAIETALNREHEFSTGGTVTDQAHHKKGSARAFFQDAEPGTRVDSTAFSAQDLGSLWFDTDATPDNTFYVLTATTPTWTLVSTEIIATTVAAAHTWAASQTLDAGADLIGSSTSDITFNTNKFTVAGATGNTLVAGTLDVQGNIDPTTYETTNGGFLDEDAMGSDAADKTASQQSIKAYVDSITDPAYSGGESHTFEGTLTIKGGVTGSITTGTTVSYGTGFGTSTISVIITANDTTNTNNATAGSITKDDFILYHNKGSAGAYYWIAIGH